VRASTGRVPRLTGAAAEVGIVGLGVLFVGLGVFDFLTNGCTPLEFVLATLPALATLVLWAGVRRLDYSASFYPRLFVWTLAGTGGLVAIVAFALLGQGGSLTEALPLVQFLGGVGSTGGLVAGVNEFRSVEAAREAERAQVEAELSERERERLQFLNNLLRHNVLNSVHIAQGYASIVREKTDADAELDTIETQHEAVVALVENVRVLVQSTAGETDRRPVDLRPVLLDEVESLEYANAPVAVWVEVPEGLVVRADPLVRYVFENVLTNAVEHSDRDVPQVAVTAEGDGEWVVVRVADDGPGISDARNASVFEPTGPGNHGLGLYLVDTLVSGYGGSIHVDDNEERGAVFEIRLPAA
jgi:signal transduction histidine kinase